VSQVGVALAQEAAQVPGDDKAICQPAEQA
jgi:hypothetical protein